MLSPNHAPRIQFKMVHSRYRAHSVLQNCKWPKLTNERSLDRTKGAIIVGVR